MSTEAENLLRTRLAAVIVIVMIISGLLIGGWLTEAAWLQALTATLQGVLR